MHLRRAMSCYPAPEMETMEPSASPAGEPNLEQKHWVHSPMLGCAWRKAEQLRRPPPSAGLASMFNFSHAARVTPNRVCCNALLAAYARAKPPQWHKVRRRLPLLLCAFLRAALTPVRAAIHVPKHVAGDPLADRDGGGVRDADPRLRLLQHRPQSVRSGIPVDQGHGGLQGDG